MTATNLEATSSENLGRKLRDFDAPHQYRCLRSIAARCEKGVRSHDLLHDLWKVMSALKDSRLVTEKDVRRDRWLTS